jgi:hypothetical protein
VPGFISLFNAGNVNASASRIISGVMLPPALFLEEAKAFLRFFFGEL